MSCINYQCDLFIITCFVRVFVRYREREPVGGTKEKIPKGETKHRYKIYILKFIVYRIKCIQNIVHVAHTV